VAGQRRADGEPFVPAGDAEPGELAEQGAALVWRELLSGGLRRGGPWSRCAAFALCCHLGELFSEDLAKLGRYAAQEQEPHAPVMLGLTGPVRSGTRQAGQHAAAASPLAGRFGCRCERDLEYVAAIAAVGHELAGRGPFVRHLGTLPAVRRS